MIKVMDRWIGEEGRCWVCGRRDAPVYTITFVMAARIRTRRPTEWDEVSRTDLFAYVPLCLEHHRAFPLNWQRPNYSGNVDALLKEFPLSAHGFDPETDVQESGSDTDLLEIVAVPKGMSSAPVRPPVALTGRRARAAAEEPKAAKPGPKTALPSLSAPLPPRARR